MAHSEMRSGDRILSGLAALVARSQKIKGEAPGPVFRKVQNTGPDAEGTAGTAREEATAETPGPRRTRGPQKKPTKVQISIRFDPDVLEALRAGGRGWQSRLNDELRELLELGALMPETDNRESRSDDATGEPTRQQPPEGKTDETVVALHDFRRTEPCEDEKGSIREPARNKGTPAG